MLTLTPLPKVLSTLAPLILGVSTSDDLDLDDELEMADWTAELMVGWRAART